MLHNAIIHQNVTILSISRSLMWLRNNDKGGVDHELIQLQSHLASHSGKSVGLTDLFRDRGTIKALIISVTLFAGQHTSGYAIMVTLELMNNHSFNSIYD